MCFFSGRNAQRIVPLSSSRCQNGPLWTSKLSRVHVHQPVNSPDVAWTAPSWRGGAFLGTKFTGLSSWVGREWLHRAIALTFRGADSVAISVTSVVGRYCCKSLSAPPSTQLRVQRASCKNQSSVLVVHSERILRRKTQEFF